MVSKIYCLLRDVADHLRRTATWSLLAITLAPSANALSPEELFERFAPSTWVARAFDAQAKLLGQVFN
jgi:hypothetical protein